MLLTGPALALFFTSLDPTALMMALTLTPVAATIALASTDRRSEHSLAGGVWPALAAIAGLLLILPQPSLTHPLNDMALLLAPILTGIGAVFFFSSNQTRSPAAPTTSTALSGAALAFTLALLTEVLTHTPRPPFSLPAAILDGLLALLAVLALTRLGPTRWTSQFTLVPLAVLLESFILMRPKLDARTLIGLALLALATVYLLLPPADADDPTLNIT